MDSGSSSLGPPGTLFERVYSQLRAIAAEQIRNERPGHTLQATALVHEVYLKLVGNADPVPLTDRARFYAAAAEAMRHILIDHARRRGAAKRGGGRRAIDLSGVLDLASDPDPDQIVAFDGAFLRLQEVAPQAAAVVRLRFFAGLEVDATAAALGISPRTVHREWTFARAWLYRELGGLEGESA